MLLGESIFRIAREKGSLKGDDFADHTK